MIFLLQNKAMKHTSLYLIILIGLFAGIANPHTVRAQHTFHSTSLSDALIQLDESSKRYDINFVYDELEDFTVSKTIKKGRSLPDAVREVCGFYPVKVRVKGRDIFVECIKKDRTKLTGRLVDSERQPVAYANITLFHPFDSTYIGGGVSNEAGDFVIPCGEEKAKVRISCIGFKTIERTMPISHVGTIRMQMENNYLSNVTINGRLPILRNEVDRLQYIVANDQFAKGQNALELLYRVPMVTMMNGHASILGKGDAGFMFNGRVTILDEETIRQRLWSMQAEDIERIEVISNPSGRHQMDAAGGYINIVTYSGQLLGWRGDITGQIGKSEDWSEQLSATASYASKKLDMTLGADIERKTDCLDELTNYTKMDSQKMMISDNHQELTDKNFGANATLRFMPTKNLELGAMASFRHQRSNMDITDITTNKGTKYSEGSQRPTSPAKTLNLTAYCDWTLDSLGKLLSLTYNQYREDNANSFVVSTSIPSGGYYKSRCLSDGKYYIQSLKLDATLPFPFATIETGAAYTHIHNESNVEDKRILMGFPRSWSTDYDYQEKTSAFYLNLSKSFGGKFTAKAGIRYEQTHLKGFDRMVVPVTNLTYNPYTLNGAGVDDRNNRDYSKFLPSILLSYRLAERHLLNLSWSMGISRPNFYDLNPFEVYSSSTTIKTGNPSLLPSTSNNVELSYSNGLGLNAIVYYHHGDDMIDWITAFHDEVFTTHDSYVTDDRNYQVAFERETRPLNCYKNDRAGLYLRWQHQFSRQFSIAAEGNLYYYHAQSDIDVSKFLVSHIDYMGPDKVYHEYKIHMPDINGWGKQVAVSADLFLNHQHTLLLNARYDHCFSEYKGLTTFDSYGYFNFALRYSMLKDRLKLSLVARDPFNQHILNASRFYQILLYDLSEYSHQNPHTQRISLTLTYSLGGKSVRHIKRDTKDTESQRAEKQQ